MTMIDPSTPELPDLVGLSVEAAEARGHTVRVTSEDGVGLFGTCDFLPDRVNVAVVDGVISQVLDFG